LSEARRTPMVASKVSNTKVKVLWNQEDQQQYKTLLSSITPCSTLPPQA
jgi:hypothetical protein